MSHLRIPLLCSLILLTGAGCFGIGASKSAINEKTDGGVFKTTDAGVHWSQVVALPTSQGVASISGTNILAMKMDPEDNQVLYLGMRESGMAYSYDAGASWQRPKSDAVRDGMIGDVAVDPKHVCTLYAIQGQRLEKSTDCLRSFNAQTYVESRPDVGLARIAVDWYNDSVLWLGLTNGDLLKSDDAGNTWRKLTQAGASIQEILVNKKDSRIVLVATAGAGFYKTTDAGATWTHSADELNNFPNSTRVFSLSEMKDSAVVLAATAYGLLRSKDFGSTWEGLTLITAPGQVLIETVGVDPNNADHIYYAAGQTFYSSADAGVTWKTSNLLTTRLPKTLLVDPVNPAIVYIGMVATK